MAHPDPRPSRWLLALSLGLFGSVFTACTMEQSEPSPAPVPAQASPPASATVPVMRQVRSYGLDPSWPVPSDFPVMLGCTDEELAHPDPLVEGKCRKICEAGQLGLYQLSEDTSLSADDQHSMAMMIMGETLQRLAEAREAVGSGSPDGGSSPSDGGMP